MAEQADMLRALEPPVRPAGSPPPRTRPRPPIEQRPFDELLRDAAQAAEATRTQPLHVSAHAQKRLDQMGVDLNDREMNALGEATDLAAAKGANESLMLLERLGLIVNVPNRTVVTVLSEQRMNEGIVTQIDSTVWVKPTRDPELQDQTPLTKD